MRPSHLSPIRRFTDGGKSTHGNGACGTRYTRPSRTARTFLQSGSARTDAAKAGSIAMTISGSQPSTCSGETTARPPGISATLRAPNRSRLSTLMDPRAAVSSPFGPRA